MGLIDLTAVTAQMKRAMLIESATADDPELRAWSERHADVAELAADQVLAMMPHAPHFLQDQTVRDRLWLARATGAGRAVQALQGAPDVDDRLCRTWRAPVERWQPAPETAPTQPPRY